MIGYISGAILALGLLFGVGYLVFRCWGPEMSDGQRKEVTEARRSLKPHHIRALEKHGVPVAPQQAPK